VSAAGALTVNGVRLASGDGAAIKDERRLTFHAIEDCELVLVDAPEAPAAARANAA
jgi:hypothetical protein